MKKIIKQVVTKPYYSQIEQMFKFGRIIWVPKALSK